MYSCIYISIDLSTIILHLLQVIHKLFENYTSKCWLNKAENTVQGCDELSLYMIRLDGKEIGFVNTLAAL
jgi:hypothetical protein